MKINYILFFLFIFLFNSCNRIEKKDLQGYWIVLPSGYQEPYISEIEFKNDSVKIIDVNSFSHSEEYVLKNNKLKIKSMEFDLKFSKQSSDTIYLNQTKYVKQKNKLELDEFKLIGITTDQKLSEIKNQIIPIHCYQNSKGIFKVRNGNKHVDLDKLKFGLTSHHQHFYPDIVLFIGESISLSNLKEVYYEMLSLNIRKAILVVNYHFPNDFDIFHDRIEIWWDDINNYYLDKGLPPFPPMAFSTKNDILKNDYKTIIIQNNKDINKIENLMVDKTYFISIDPELKISDYIELKKVISTLRTKGFSIETEIVKNET